MPFFDILCLANFNKMRGSCVAGLRLDGGGWIRPVAPTPYGELHPAHYTLPDGTCPRVFDWLRISFVEPRPLTHQPENWLIADRPWQLMSRGLAAEFAPLLEAYLEDAPALFGDFTHKISAARLATDPVASSLGLIRPAELTWAIEQSAYNQHKARAQFRLGDTAYRLPVTDPAWHDAFRGLAVGTHPVTACGIAADQRVLLTMSLSDPLDGYCYKLVSAILPLAPGIIAEPPVTPDPPDPAMDAREAAWIIRALADGSDPYTGEPLPADGPLSNPDTIKALRAAAEALEGGPPKKKQRELPAQAGKAWDAAEEEILLREFDAGEKIPAIARAHGRTRGAIKARLIRWGRITE